MTQIKVSSSAAERIAARRQAKLVAQREGATVELNYLGETVVLKLARIGPSNTAHKAHMEAFRGKYRDAKTGEVDIALMPPGANDATLKESLAHNVILDLQLKGDTPLPYTSEVGALWLADDDFYGEVLSRAYARDTFDKAALEADAGN